MSAIGVREPRRDSAAKVRGATRFAADIPVVGLLHARLVLAYEAHAQLRGIDASAALELPGVVAVLSAADLPVAASGRGRAFSPLARDEVVYAGEPVAVVVAESEHVAADAIELVAVELEPLEAVVDLEAAARPGAPLARVHRETGAGSDVADAHAAVSAEAATDEELSENVLGSARLHSGDVDAALAASDVVLRGRFRTPWIHQGYLETQTATAWLDPDGTLVVNASTQGTFSARDTLCEVFDLPAHRVRVQGAPLGGAFGGKFGLIEPLVAAIALAVRRPVRLALTRSEDLAATNPAGAELIDLELGATREGKLTALRSRTLYDRGSTEEFGVESIAAMLSAGPYLWPAHDLVCHGVQTNRVSFGAYRAPTAPPAAFAIESLLDELAERLEIDPIELRLRNVAGEGDMSVAGQPFPVFGARDCLERLRAHELWQRRGSLPQGEGVGVAIGWWPGGYEPAAAACRLDADGGVTVVTAAADMTGVETAFATIAAEAFGVEPGRVRVVQADTASAPYAGSSGGSKVTYTVGRAVEAAAREARRHLLEVAANELEISVEDLEIVDGSVQPVGDPARAQPIERLARKTLSFGGPYAPVEGHGRVGSGPRAPQSAGHISHVRVDADTGAVQVLGHVIAQDVGHALNPALVEGQMHGGTVQGLGWALHEELVHDERGQLITGTLVDYGMPVAAGLTFIDTEIVEVPAPEGPFGAKGVGEPPVIAVAPAVANAVAAATGKRLRELPMTPERVWRALTG
ncbi:MAG TPA: xanthine dehydrogenase family protein molybdopterin-binding subunit [Solirubrobacteraceae bacterium]|nr:xanthine dehydrogenase family protein molybdopterin-binding subunit [Solirubrobacteraceae bacterium]